jgi:DNA-directed RNA polymerase omega subunit
LNPTNGIDSKFRFVILAAKRAKQLLHGDKPKIKTKAKNPIRIAQEEVRFGAVDYDIVEPKVEESREPEDEGFIGEVIGGEEEVEEEVRKPSRGKRVKKEEPEKGEEEEPESDEEELEPEEKEEEEEEEGEEGDEGSEEEVEK